MPDDVTLKELVMQAVVELDRRFTDRIHSEEKAREALFRAQSEALRIASETMNERLEQMNQFREQIQRERGSYVTRELHDSLAETQNEALTTLSNTFSVRVTAVERWQNKIIGALVLVNLFVPVVVALVVWAIIRK